VATGILEGVSKVALASPGCKAPWLCRLASTIEPTSPASAFVPWGFSLEPFSAPAPRGLGPTINFWLEPFSAPAPRGLGPTINF